MFELRKSQKLNSKSNSKILIENRNRKKTKCSDFINFARSAHIFSTFLGHIRGNAPYLSFFFNEVRYTDIMQYEGNFNNNRITNNIIIDISIKIPYYHYL